MNPIIIRLAEEADLQGINDIYNHFVLHCTCTYQTEPETMEDRKAWFAHHGAKHPVTVAIDDGRVVGWGSLSAFHRRAAYSHTVENSVYVDHRKHGRGIGRMLLADLIGRATEIGHHSIIAGIDASQAASVSLHVSQGFHQVGYLREVGFKFGRWLDVIYMQRML